MLEASSVDSAESSPMAFQPAFLNNSGDFDIDIDLEDSPSDPIGRKHNKRRSEDEVIALDWNPSKRIRLESYRREMAWEIN
jgi:hypothetical protein